MNRFAVCRPNGSPGRKFDQSELWGLFVKILESHCQCCACIAHPGVVCMSILERSMEFTVIDK